MGRIAQTTSLAIWHRGCSNRRPNRSESPNRRHFASLDLKNMPIFASLANIAGFSRELLWLFSCEFRLSSGAFASLVKQPFCIASDLAVCDSNRIAHRGGIVRFGPLRSKAFKIWSCTQFSHGMYYTIRSPYEIVLKQLM